MITQDQLKEVINYNPLTGDFTWRHRGESFFKTYRSYRSFCGKYDGKVAGNTKTSKEGKTYRNIMIFDTTYLSHRLAWLYVTGSFPCDEIDHIDGNGENNRLVNLRDVTRTENGRNKRKPVTNKSGVMGVHWHKRDLVWCAQIKVDQKVINLGTSTSIESEIKLRRAAEIKYNFHPNHGDVRPL